MLLHKLQVLIPRFLGIGLEDTARHEVFLHLSITPSGVDVVLGFVKGLQGIIGASRNPAREGVGDGGGERVTGVLVRIVMVLGEEDQLLPGSLRFHDPLFEKELAETRLVPRFEGGVLEVLEGLLSVGVLIVSPGGVRPPVLRHEVLEIFF